MVRTRFPGLIALALPLALVACGQRDKDDRNLDSLDNELIEAGNANTHDPAMMSALQDQIMADPSLARKANNDAVRPPAQPLSGAVPPDGIAAAPAGTAAPPGQAPSQATRSTPAPCAGALRYSAGWADRRPADLPLYPDARVSEAAGSQNDACALRAVSFSTSASLQQVMDWYYTRATNAGYSAEQQADGGQ